MGRIWTADEIGRLVQENDIVLYRAIKQLYDRQTEDEKDVCDTTHRNGVGFNGVDGKFMSSIAEYLIFHRYLTPKQKICTRKKLVKYTKQLTNIANAMEAKKEVIA